MASQAAEKFDPELTLGWRSGFQSVCENHNLNVAVE